MKIYEIIDNDNKSYIGCLIYYEKSDDYIVELVDGIDEWDAPFLFDKYVRAGEYTIPRKASRLWVEERVIPSDRQNIGAILRNHKMKEYNVQKLLDVSKGKCAQDNLYLRLINELPEYINRRFKDYLSECVALSDNRLLCFFNNGITKISHLSQYTDIDKIDSILRNENVYKTCCIATGGRCVTFNDSIDISYKELINRGEDINISLEDFLTFTKQNILDTTESCMMLDCSRQNISYFIKSEKLNPVKEEVRGSLFLKSDIARISW